MAIRTTDHEGQHLRIAVDRLLGQQARPQRGIAQPRQLLRQRILAGRFTTTIYDIELEGKKHRVIPRDFHLDPVKDFPLHVDFMTRRNGFFANAF